MLVFVRTATAAIVFGMLAFAGSGAMPGSADADPIPFEERWGDLNCTGEVQSVDARYPLGHVAGFEVFIPEGICWDTHMGMFPESLLQIEGGPQVQWADVDCNGTISSVDALWILRYVVGLGVPSFSGCPEIGAMTTLSHVWSQAGAAQVEPSEPQLLWADVDCYGTVTGIDALIVLRTVAGVNVRTQDTRCLDPDALLQVQDGPQVHWADIDCNGGISSVDALRILRYVAGYHIALVTGCPEVGAPVSVSFPSSQ